MPDNEPKFPGYRDQPIDVRERAEQLIERMSEQLTSAVEIVAPGSDSEVKDVFLLPSERRDDDAGLELSEDQEIALRDIASNLGWGRQTDKSAESVGLSPGYVAIIEGGQSHKVMTELLLAREGHAGIYFVAGSPNRRITNEAERTSGCNILGIPQDVLADTEYDVNRQLVESIDDFTPNPDGDVELEASYDISKSHELNDQSSGQFVHIGNIYASPVILMRIDREDYLDGDKQKYRNQPDSADVIGIVSSVTGDSPNFAQIGYVTSSTYEPSRSIDQIRAMARTGKQVELVTYGTESLARVKGVPSQSGPINQLPGELRKTDASLELLKQEIA